MENAKGIAICHVCLSTDNRKVQRCSKCKSVYYCSRECQIKDWPNHKSECATFADEKPVENMVKLFTAHPTPIRWLLLVAIWKIKDPSKQCLECLCVCVDNTVKIYVSLCDAETTVGDENYIRIRFAALINGQRHPITSEKIYKSKDIKKLYEEYLSIDGDMDHIDWPAIMKVSPTYWGFQSGGEMVIDDL